MAGSIIVTDNRTGPSQIVLFWLSFWKAKLNDYIFENPAFVDSFSIFGLSFILCIYVKQAQTQFPSKSLN